MAKIIDTSLTNPDDLPAHEQDWCYNGFDTCLTHEIYTIIREQLDEHTGPTYEFSKALQGPVIEMRLRGVLIDQARKAQVIDQYYETIEMLETNLERIILDGLGRHTFNWRSNADLQDVFYTRLGIPPIIRQGRPTVDRNALERLEAYQIARPIVRHIQALRELGKKIGVLKTEIDPDGRIRTSYNIAGTSTGRFSSSFSEFGTGSNLQNIEESLRSIFISDPGYKFAKCDAKSGESFIVGAIEWNLFGDDRYLEACETGDPHTATARICWPNLGWTGDLKRDKDIAESPYYRHYTYRFMCKKLGHGSNYGGMPDTLATQAKLPRPVVEQFQPNYFRAFPAHLRWHEWVKRQLLTKGYLISLGGRKRWFLGRRNDPSTFREAVAYDPQETLAKIVNSAMLNIWRKRTSIIIMHDHDALTFMYPEELEDEVIPQIMRGLEYPVQLANGRQLLIPYDCKVGWNRGEYNEKTNPDGLRDYKPGDGKRKRQPKLGILDRPLRSIS